jgi:hypothetical protein
MKGNAHHKANKVYYFDSNDEMFCGSEVSFSEGESDCLNDTFELKKKNKRYAKVFMQATEDERKRIRELISKQK